MLELLRPFLWWAIFVFVLGLVATVGLNLYFHERGWRRGYEEGHDKGVKEGFEAGKSYAFTEIGRIRQQVRKEGWP